MLAVRKVYQRAIVTPTHHVEQHWRDYENFENSVSRALAKGLVSEYQPKYNSARAVYRERKKYVDEIDWNLLAVPPSGSVKEELQWKAWKKFLAFEKENPQRIDAVSANKRISFTYEQCLMYLYHYPDIWFDYATWHAKSGSIESAIKVYQRSLKALPDCALLRYAYAELEESRGAIQPAKKVYEGLLGVNATALSHIQYIRFLRRTEGVEAARKYFIDARKSPNCTYHVYVAYATMAFCMDKDAKSRGMQSTINVELAPGVSVEDLKQHLTKFYEKEEFVAVLPDGQAPHTKYVQGSNGCHINVFPDRPLPDVDYVISICLQSTLPIMEPTKLPTQPQARPASSDVSGSSKSHLFKPRDRQHGKRKNAERQVDDDTTTVQSQPLPKDAFKIRQMRKARAANTPSGAASFGSVQTGSASYGSGFSGEHSGSF
nr:cleavage stimulation factor subunit 77 [Tanacetum cinerariifolium]